MIAARRAPAPDIAPNETLPEFIDARRVYCALEASWQAEACARTGLRLLSERGADRMEVESVMRALLLRVVGLAECAADALNDEDQDVAAAREALGLNAIG